MRIAIVGGMIFLALLSVGSLSADAAQERNYCPEKDFVDLCIEAMTSLPATAEWAKANGWRTQRQQLPTLEAVLTIRSESPRSFTVFETRFSDTVYLRCRYDAHYARIVRTTTKCGEEFRIIRDSIPENVVTTTLTAKDGGARSQWVFEVGTWRVFIEATSHSDKKFSRFKVTKIQTAVRQ